MELKKFVEENYYIVISLMVFSLLFYIGLGDFFDHKLDHDYPFNFFAEDQFSHLLSAQGVKDLGHNLYVPPYMNMGFEKTFPDFGPGMSHWIVITDSVTPYIEMYNSMQLLLGIIFLLLPFIFVNALGLKQHIKLVSLSLTPLLFQFNWIIGYSWGQIGAITGTFFLFSFYAVYNSKYWKNYWIIAILLAAACMVHFPEGFFLVFFVGIFFIYDAYNKRKELSKNKLRGIVKNYRWLILSVIVFLLISGFYLLIFYYGNIQKFEEVTSTQEKKWITFTTPEEFGGIRTVKITDFNWIILIGIVVGIVILAIFYKSRARYILFFSLALTFLNYFGFFMFASYRAFQQRTFWPFTLMPFFSIGIFFILGEFLKIKGKTLKIIALVLFLAIFYYSFSTYTKVTGPGVITKEQFDAFQYLDENKKDDGMVLLIYGDGYSQSHPALKNLHVLTWEKNMVIFLEQKADIKNNFSFLKVEWGTPAVLNGTKIDFVNTEHEYNATFCDFDYYILDKTTRFGNPLIEFNKLFVQSINEESFEVFYENAQTLILKRKSDNCWREDDNK